MARITIDTEYPRFPVEKKLFGHFTEHAFSDVLCAQKREYAI